MDVDDPYVVDSTRKEVVVVGNDNPFTKDPTLKNRPGDTQNCCICRRSGFCHPCMRVHNPLPERATYWQKCHYILLCPPHGICGYLLTFLLAILLLWATTWSVLGEDALPGGNIFSLLVMFVACNVGGILFELIKLPGLLGMLVTGFILRNVPNINIARDIDAQWSSDLRTIALVVILLRAGLGLDYERLKKLSAAVLRLSLLPCFTEVATVALLATLLFDFPWDFAFMLGFVHAAVSPAVVVPSMLVLQEKKLGTKKGVPTMLIAAGSLENVVAISGFSLTLGITFSSGSLVFNILRCPMEIAIGLIYGITVGIILWYIPQSQHNRLSSLRFLLLVGGGLFSTFGAKFATVPGAGALGCLVLAFTAAHGWRKQTKGEENVNVINAVSILWLVFQPLLFGLIGAEVKVEHLKGDVIGLGAGILIVALLLRCFAAFLSVLGTPLTHKEKLFVMLSWIPKATVQAAIGSNALDAAKNLNKGQDAIDKGTLILTIAVFVIVVTAPIGAALIALTAPRLLLKEMPDTHTQTLAKDKADEEDNNTGQSAESIDTKL